MKLNFLFILLAFLSVMTSNLLYSQVIDNITFKVIENNKIIIKYYLNASSDKSHYAVKIFATVDGEKYFGINSLEGDSKEISGSGYKQVIWDVFKDVEIFEGPSCGIKIQSEEITTFSDQLSSIFLGNESTKLFANGSFILFGISNTDFNSSSYKTSKQNGDITSNIGYNINYQYITVPLILSSNVSLQSFNSSDGTKIDLMGIDITGSFILFPNMRYILPAVGIGYQISQLSIGESSDQTANTSSVFLTAHINILFGSESSRWIISGEYKKSFGNSERGWVQYNITIGLNFSFFKSGISK